jgi:acyl-coenzyme A synthetase/AMP-(fatty) acid ligase
MAKHQYLVLGGHADWVQRCGKCGRLFYAGRRDLQFKRSGHRMHPAPVERIIETTAKDAVRAAKIIYAGESARYVRLGVVV